MAGQSTPKTNRMRRWMRVLLVVSLALNLLVIGAVGGAMFMRGKWKPSGAHRGAHGGPLTRALSPEDRHAIGQKMREAHNQARPSPAEHQRLVADIKAVPFDPEAVAARLRKHRAAMLDQFELGQRLLIERLSAMTDAERAAFADRLKEHKPKRRNGSGG